jgi:light-regulated signal transduction histidine kinase (bacteriophytochrome)
MFTGERWAFWEPRCRAALRGDAAHADVAGAAAGSRFYRVELGPWRDHRGEIVGGLAIAHDITDRRHAVDELEAFNYSVSHDLRAPLRAIDGFSAAVVRRNADQLDDSGREMLARIRKAVANMSTLIDAMLQLSRLSRRELTRDQVDITALAQDVVDDLLAGEPGREVEIVIEAGLHAVGDRVLLRIVLENLLGNAWKFTCGREQARIELARVDSSGRDAFVLRDNGAGFDEAGSDRLFAPFQRLHREDEFPGVGIGLATVKRIIGRHDGTIRGEGTPGAGAAFHFELGRTEDDR